ncbi:MAG: cell division protein FtsK [Crocinitomicaceae bacterium]|nr:cell division protein FtsK [Crocinitomicaceae bacterium]|tara:strand:+ start:11948 stop:14413 length:2466 start_codon:yes stop_codon:yes gene_type:complete
MSTKNQYKNFQFNSKKKKDKKEYFVGIKSFFNDERFHKTSGLFLILISTYLFFAFTSYLFTWKYDLSIIDGKSIGFVFNGEESEIHNWLGKFGAYTAHQFLKVWYGVSSYIFAFLLFIVGFKALFKHELLPMIKTFKVSFISLIWFCMFFGFVFQNSDLDFMGGLYGQVINEWLEGVLGSVGTGFFIFFFAIGSVILLFNPSLSWVVSFFNKLSKWLFEKKIDENGFSKVPTSIDIVTQNPEKEKKNDSPSLDLQVSKEEEINSSNDLELETPDPSSTSKINKTTQSLDEKVDLAVEVGSNETELSEKDIKNKVKEFGEYDPKLDLSNYKLPNIDLLIEHGSGNISVDQEELEANKNKIIETLLNYKINISKIKATIGPTITLYEIIPAPGVRISKIKNLEDDIALSLAALGIRIIAPMPGKGTVGIEVPNSKPEIVAMKSLIASDKFQNSNMELPVALGKTISNESLITDLTKMPHLLMAGATGQGKSVGLNAILVSILYKKHPSQVKFVLIDPKKVELTIYNKIERHFLAKLPDEEEAIITDTTKVVNTLNSLCVEMEARYELLKEAMVRTIKEYNHKFIQRKLNPEKGHKYMPYIVLVIDEFADLIMTAGKEVETPVARIAQLARAVGIHLIIATQRPSVNVITGTIKANFPARIAFRVTSKIDSRTILDAGGADQLIGRGDMLFSPGNELIRLQCGFVDTPEVDNIADFIGSQRGYPHAFLLPEYVDEASELKELDDDLDSLFEEAAEVIVNHQQGSASLLQRKLKLGYNRAGRIVDQLEATGLLGPHRGSKAREVLIPDVIALEQFLNNLKEKGKL